MIKLLWRCGRKMAFKSRKQKKLEKEQKRQEVKRKQYRGIYWFVVIILALLGMVAFPSFGAIVFFIGAIAALPIKAIKNMWGKIPVKAKWFKPVVLAVVFILAIGTTPASVWKYVTANTDSIGQFDLSAIPAYSGKAYVVVNDNNPFFIEAELIYAATSYESYSNLDDLERCGVSIASVGRDIMPTEKRGSIGSVRPSGWQTVKYNGVVSGNYLYNRCHLIGFQLTGENANTKNLITGTRYMNVDGMLPFENMVADYVKETGNHVLYSVTPIFEGSNLVASGVLMEAKSVEDNGDGILFNVYVYNEQPGVIIDYKTGNSELDGTISVQEPTLTPTATPIEEDKTPTSEIRYVLNTNTKKFHNPTCSSVKTIKDSNMQEYKGDREDLISQGYDPCKRCNP